MTTVWLGVLMSSGMVTTNLRRRPDKVRSPYGVAVNLPPIMGVPNYSVLDFALPNPVTSFRSGPNFERASLTKGAITSTPGLGEIFAHANGDIGHEFSMRKVTDFYGYTNSRRINSSLPIYFAQMPRTVPTFLSDPGTTISPASNYFDPNYGFCSSDSKLSTIGTSFIRSTNPIQSQVDLLSDIAEAFVDGVLLPELLGKSIIGAIINPSKRGGIVRALGGDYLNYIFGFLPLAQDAAKVGVLIDHVNSLVNQWIKDNGTIVRRRRMSQEFAGFYKGGDLKSSSFVSGGSVSVQWIIPQNSAAGFTRNALSIGLGTAGPSVQLTGHSYVSLQQELTFSAGYQYDLTRLLIPVLDGTSAADLMHDSVLRGQLDLIAFGLDPASIPKAAYDAIPFSWLLDWFVNLGDLFDNFRGLQARGVQLLWGYLTETSIYRSDYFGSLRWIPTGEEFFHSSGTAAQKAVRRIRATPFGFGVSFDSLSQSQLATLAALLAAKT